MRNSRFVRARIICALAVAGVAAPLSHAVEQGTNSTNVPALAGLAWVGRQQTQDMMLGESYATGSLIRQNIILGAGHCVGTASPGNSRYFNMFQWELGGAQYPALAVVHPNYANNVGNGNFDLAYFVVLNGQNLVPAAANMLATAAEEQAIIDKINGNPGMGIAGQPQNVTLVGNQSSDNTVNAAGALQGISRVRMVPAGADVGEWTYSRKQGPVAGYPGSNWINTGDSGGPTLAVVNGNTRIIGVHSFRTGADPLTATTDVDTRVGTNRNFIDGKGVAGSTTLVYYTGAAAAGTYNWPAAANWTRTGAAMPNAVPQGGDVVVLDRTSGLDTTTILNTGNLPDPDLEGLVTDYTLNIGSAAAVVQFTVSGKSGALNGGSIYVKQKAVLTVGYQLNNTTQGQLEADDQSTIQIGLAMPASDALNAAGTLTQETLSLYNKGSARVFINSGSSAQIGAQTKNDNQIFVSDKGSVANFGTRLPATINTATNAVTGAVTANRPSLSLWNRKGGLVKVLTGGTLNVETQYANNGELEITGADADGTYATMSVGASLPAGSGTLASPGFPTALINYVDGAGAGLITINPGGSLKVSNGASKTAQLFNAAGAEITVKGAGDILGANAGGIYADVYTNSGTINLLNTGQLNTGLSFMNTPGGKFVVDGQATGFSYARTGVLFNPTSAGALTAGSITIKSGRVIATRPSGLIEGPALLNNGRMTMQDFSVLNSNGQFTNSSTGELSVTSMAGGTQPKIEIRKSADYATQGLVNDGKITFAGGAPYPGMYFGNSDFVTRNAATMSGPVEIQMSLGSNWDWQTTPNGSDLNESDFALLGNGTGAAHATFEAMNVNQGAVLEGFDLELATECICITSGSRVDLVDTYGNEEAPGTECQYTRYFGIDASSVLDLQGRTLYYEFICPDCGLVPGSVIDGNLIQVPEPTSLVFCLALPIALARKRR